MNTCQKIGVVGLLIMMISIILDAINVVPNKFEVECQCLVWPWYDYVMHLGGLFLVLVGITGGYGTQKTYEETKNE
jgi:hypothetical protein